MRKCIGVICVLLGFACLLGAVGFAVYNRWEAEKAAEISDSLLRAAQREIEDENILQAPAQTEMPTVSVEGEACIGILSVPVLNLELPVLSDWSYAKLKKAPCRYYGSYHQKDFVIAAHNYRNHFGKLSKLQAGDVVVFTDVNGTARYYKVELLETLPPTATEAMITGGFDLTLYTCTNGGGNRVTVRCNAVQN